ncbi:MULTISPECIES: hypothetical protein [unclassified Streptomyces]|uniref:hypothetical protein n=1 Tax=unclassified Streptomyces TaxID=2593676 RepID=UPI0028C43984|nr:MULTISPECIES: hypothetical protein [unclassified Streptomyces]WNO76774.1 hypothetical protein RPQ07_36380 [Streptomyces sp. AM8-1-1]
MQKKHKIGLAAAAAVFVTVPGGLLVTSQAAAADRDAERKSLEQAAEDVFQRRADAPGAQWRNYPAPAGKVWNQADARADVTEVKKRGVRFIVDVNEFTTPYTSDTNGRKLAPTTPYVGMYRLVFERDGDDWRLVQDLSDQLTK